MLYVSCFLLHFLPFEICISVLFFDFPSHSYNSEVSSGFFYSNAEEREKLVASERKFTDEKVNYSPSFSLFK